jgi:cytochrome b
VTERDVPGASPATVRAPLTLVWDWPLRVWHWLFALCLAGSLTTGLLGDISLMDWHMRLGFTAIGLLLFRLGWALWGARYARWHTFAVTPARFVAFVRGVGDQGPRTAPGAALGGGGRAAPHRPVHQR